VWRWSKETYLKNKDKIFVKRVRSSNLVDSNGNAVLWNVFTKTFLNDVIANSTAKPNSLIEDHINQNSSHELKELGVPFSFAKPSSLIKYLCEISRVKSDEVVLDFFAGSGTTAHGVMDYNSEFGENARWILIQLDEPLRFDDKNQKDGYIFCEKHNLPKIIPSLTKERIRRAATAISRRAEREGAGDLGLEGAVDLGFRVLTLGTSNMADVYYAPDALEKEKLDLFVDNIKPERTGEDLLFQVMLDWGVDLTLPIEKKTIQGKHVFFVDGNALAACFDAHSGVDEAFVKELATNQPLRVLFRDAGFKDSAVKINVEQIFKLLSPTTEVKSI
jgi:adenine-specific DNA-methyltransferase